MSTGSAPALESGLTIIEMLAQSSQGLGFNALDSQTGVSRGTTSRLLRVLQSRGWVQKEESSGKYCLGPRAELLPSKPNPMQVFTEESKRILPELCSKAKNSVIAVFWDGANMECVGKETHIESVPMQPVGNRTADLSMGPWGWVFYSLLSEERKKAIQSEIHFPNVFGGSYKKAIGDFHKNGFVYDPQIVFEHVRRIGAPVYGGNGKMIGALGLGGNQLTLKTNQIQVSGALVVEYAKRLSARLM